MISQKDLAAIDLWQRLVTKLYQMVDEKLARGGQVEAGELKLNRKAAVVRRWWSLLTGVARRASRVIQESAREESY